MTVKITQKRCVCCNMGVNRQNHSLIFMIGGNRLMVVNYWLPVLSGGLPGCFILEMRYWKFKQKVLKVQKLLLNWRSFLGG